MSNFFQLLKEKIYFLGTTEKMNQKLCARGAEDRPQKSMRVRVFTASLFAMGKTGRNLNKWPPKGKGLCT